MDPNERRAQGAHYTTEKNISKVIEPLFMEELRAEFERLKARRDSRRRPDLLRFQERLGRLNFLDPACGCGNFLIIAYRELRALEIEVLEGGLFGPASSTFWRRRFRSWMWTGSTASRSANSRPGSPKRRCG